MKINKIFIFAIVALPALVLQSCLKDDDDKFSQSASERMETFVTEAQQTLINAPYGWAFDYYPEASQSYGGVTYTVKFSKDSAAVRFENQFSAGEQTSLYSMKKDDGPVISFDTYNTFMHYFATPSSDLTNGYEGDFEFVIDSISDDLIKVHGKRTLNTMYLHRLDEDAASYMNKVVNIGDAFHLAGASLNIGGAEATADFDESTRHIEIVSGTDSINTAYTFTDKGIRLYQPVTINGQTISELTYDDDALSLTADGVTTTKGFVNPNVVTNVIGSVGADDNAFTRTFRNIAHLDELGFYTTADWVTITPNGNNLTISGQANTTGEMRTATVYVYNKANQNYVATFTVSQCTLRDVLGTYRFVFYNSDNQLQQATATLSQTRSGVQLQIVDGDYTYNFTGRFDQSHAALMIPQLQRISSWNTRSYGTIYAYNIYAVASGNYYFMPQLEMPVYFQSSSRLGTYAYFGGENMYFNGENLGDDFKVDQILIYVSQQPTITSTQDFLGYWDYWTNGVIQRTAGASRVAAKNLVPEQPKTMRPISIKRISGAEKE